MIKLVTRVQPRRPRLQDPFKSTLVQLRVDLRYARPPIWRRIVVPGDIKLSRLHDVLQAAMGWTNSHLHAFRHEAHEYSTPDPECEAFTSGLVRDERKFSLSALAAKVGDSFEYAYDFGDNWQHDVIVEKVTPARAAPRRAVCLGGRRACPPEDCGGIPGYGELLHALAHPEKPEHRELLQWAGNFDPLHFAIHETNEILAGLRV